MFYQAYANSKSYLPYCEQPRCFRLLHGAEWVSAQSARPGMGPTPYADAAGTGYTFRVWAPNASAVGVKGQFNGWGTTPLVSEGGGIWSVDINGAQAGHEYKIRINNSFDKRDPRARRVVNSVGNSILYDPSGFRLGFGLVYHARSKRPGDLRNARGHLQRGNLGSEFVRQGDRAAGSPPEPGHQRRRGHAAVRIPGRTKAGDTIRPISSLSKARWAGRTPSSVS